MIKYHKQVCDRLVHSLLGTLNVPIFSQSHSESIRSTLHHINHTNTHKNRIHESFFFFPKYNQSREHVALAIRSLFRKIAIKNSNNKKMSRTKRNNSAIFFALVHEAWSSRRCVVASGAQKFNLKKRKKKLKKKIHAKHYVSAIAWFHPMCSRSNVDRRIHPFTIYIIFWFGSIAAIHGYRDECDTPY